MIGRLLAAAAALMLTACPKPAPPAAPAPGPAPAPTATAAAAPPAPAVDLAKRYLDWVARANAGDWAGLRAQLTEESTITPASSGMVLQGPDNIIEFYKSFSVGFADLTTTPILILVRPGQVAAVALTRGTNDVAIGGRPATGKRTSFLGLTVIDYDTAGHMLRGTAYADNLNFMGQLGLWSGDARPVDESTPDGPEIVRADAHPDATPGVALARRFAARIDAHDAPGLLALYTPDAVVDDTHLAAPIATPAAIAHHFQEMFVAFPDLSIDDLSAWGAGDYAVATFHLRGTNGGNYARLGASGTMRQIDLEAAMVLRVRGDAIAQQQIFVNGMAMGMQLGVLADPGDAPPPDSKP